jgi:hypothetical protein
MGSVLRWLLLGHELCIAFALLGRGDCLAVIGLLPFGLSVVAVCPSSVCNVLCASQEARGTNTVNLLEYRPI